MFGIGIQELILIALVGLLFFGPRRLPEVAKQFAKFYVQARRATGEMRSAFDQVVRQAEDDIRKEERDVVKKLLTGRVDIQSEIKNAIMADHPRVAPVDPAWDAPVQPQEEASDKSST